MNIYSTGHPSRPVLHLPSIHFANGSDIFSVTKAVYTDMEIGFKRLSQRSLLMAGPADTVILNKIPDKDYLSLLNSCGAGGRAHLAPENDSGSCLTDDVMKSRKILDYIEGWDGDVETYMISEKEEILSKTVSAEFTTCTSAVTALLNDKVFFTRIIEDLGLPCIETFIGPPDAASAKLLHSSSGPVIVKRAGSIGGFGVWIGKDARQRQRLGKEIEKYRSGMFLIQPYIETAVSPNLQYYIGPGNICLLGQTIQNLHDNISHFGNIFDPLEDATLNESLLWQGKALALEAASMGYRGVLGIDFIVSSENELYPVEINARHNTSTHALWFLNRFSNNDPFVPVDAGRACFLKLDSTKNLSAMEWLDLFGRNAFNQDSGLGILPYDCRNESLEAVINGKDKDHRSHLIEIATDMARKQ